MPSIVSPLHLASTTHRPNNFPRPTSTAIFWPQLTCAGNRLQAACVCAHGVCVCVRVSVSADLTTRALLRVGLASRVVCL